MMTHKVQRQQSPLRQKVSKDIHHAQHPYFLFLDQKKILATVELELTWKGSGPVVG
jgi:hypothetical protein